MLNHPIDLLRHHPQTKIHQVIKITILQASKAHSYQACKAHIGSTSVTQTTEPILFSAAAHPLPT